MVRDKFTGAWTLGDESKSPIEAPSGRKFVHIQFNGVGIDMSVVDSLGTVYLYTLTGPLGKMHLANGDLLRLDSDARDADTIVGMHWLSLYPAEFRVSVVYFQL